MTFPSSPSDNDIHQAFGRRLKYKASKDVWEVVSSPLVATVTESAPKTESVAQASNLPMTGNEIGAMAYVSESNRLYVWNGSGWFEVALVNTTPTITTGGQATYELNADGTPTVITLAANDPEGVPLTWSHAVSSGSLEDTTVTNADNVFTVTPGTVDAAFNLTFTASDGVNLATAASSFTLSFVPDWTLTTQQQKIQASDPQETDYFGQSVSISGDTVVVGAYYEDTGAAGAGAAYIFTRSGTTWTQQQKIQASDLQANDYFGQAVAIDGDTVVVGARLEDTVDYNTGAAYIFTRDGTTWTQQQKIQASDLQANDNFGMSVAIDGDTVVVGAQMEDTGGAEAGAAYVFTRSGTTWTQQQKIQASDKQADDNFSISVSISGDTAVVGAQYEDTGGINAGAAYIFTRSGTTWTQQQKIQASDIQADDLFGASVSISGDTVVVGANGEDTGASNAGAAYIFTRSGTTWTEQQKILASDIQANDFFGWSVSIDGDTVVVGATGEDTGSSNAGASYIFTRSGTTWTQQQKIQASDKELNDFFGNSVAIDGNTVVVGAHAEDTGGQEVGAAYIFVGG